MEVQLRIAGEKTAENQTIEALRLAVGGEARVEINGIGFDNEGEVGGVGVCGTRARSKEERQ